MSEQRNAALNRPLVNFAQFSIFFTKSERSVAASGLLRSIQGPGFTGF